MKKYCFTFLFCVFGFVAWPQEFNWAYPLEGPGNDLFKDLDVIQGEQLLATGQITNGADLDLWLNSVSPTINYAYSPFMARYNTAGQLEYHVVLNGLGSIENTMVKDNQNIIVAGHAETEIQLDPQNSLSFTTVPNTNGQDIFIANYDTDFNLQWSLLFGGMGNDTLSDCQIGTDGLLYFYGQFTGQIELSINGTSFNFSTWDYLNNSDALLSDAFVLVTTPSGEIERFFTFGGEGQDRTNGFVQGNGLLGLTGTCANQIYWDGDVLTPLITNPTEYQGFLICSTDQGQFQWSHEILGFAQPQIFADVDMTSEHFIAVGRFATWMDFDENDAIEGIGSLNSPDAFYAGFGWDGAPVFTHRMGGQEQDGSYEIDILNDNEIVVFSHHGNSCNFGITDYYSVGGQDIYSSQMMIYDSNGNVLGGQTWSTADYSRVNSLVRIVNDYYMVMELEGTANFDNVTPTYLTASANTDGVLMKYGVCLQPVMPEVIVSDDQICRYDSVTVTLVGGQLNGCTDWGWYLNFEPPTPFDGSDEMTFSPFYTGPVIVTGIGGCVSNSPTSWSPYIEVLNDPGGEINTWNWSNEPCDFNAQYYADLSGPSFTYTWEPPVSNTYNAFDLCEGTYIFTAMLENGCYFTDTLIFATTHTEDILLPSSISYYPNPIQEQWNITISDQKNYDLTLYNSFGEIILQTPLNKGNNTIPFNQFSSGIYVAQIRCDNLSWTTKLMKE